MVLFTGECFTLLTNRSNIHRTTSHNEIYWFSSFRKMLFHSRLSDLLEVDVILTWMLRMRGVSIPFWSFVFRIQIYDVFRLNHCGFSHPSDLFLWQFQMISSPLVMRKFIEIALIGTLRSLCRVSFGSGFLNGVDWHDSWNASEHEFAFSILGHPFERTNIERVCHLMSFRRSHSERTFPTRAISSEWNKIELFFCSNCTWCRTNLQFNFLPFFSWIEFDDVRRHNKNIIPLALARLVLDLSMDDVNLPEWWDLKFDFRRI